MGLRGTRGLDVEALYLRHRDELLVFLMRRTADPQVALDLWAETFARAVQGGPRFRGSTDAEAAGWLYAIARRQLALYQRRGHAERRALQRLRIERPVADPEVEAELERRAMLGRLRDELRDALADLPETTRRAVALRVVDELPYPDIAARLGLSEVAARARVSRGLAALARVLDKPMMTEAMHR